MRYLGMRALPSSRGHQPGPDAAITKLYRSEYHRVSTELALDILGADAPCPGRNREYLPPRRRRCAELVGLLGRHVHECPGRRRSLRGRLRSSATSSARWSSASRRNRSRLDVGPPVGERFGMIGIAGRGARPSTTVAGRPAAVAAHHTGGLVAAAPVPARAVEGLRALPPPHAVRAFRRPAVPCRCGELPRRGAAPSRETETVGRMMRNALVLNASYEPLSVVTGAAGRVPRPGREGRRHRGGRHDVALAVDRAPEPARHPPALHGEGPVPPPAPRCSRTPCSPATTIAASTAAVSPTPSITSCRARVAASTPGRTSRRHADRAT